MQWDRNKETQAPTDAHVSTLYLELGKPQEVWAGQRLYTCCDFNFSKAISKKKGMDHLV